MPGDANDGGEEQEGVQAVNDIPIVEESEALDVDIDGATERVASLNTDDDTSLYSSPYSSFLLPLLSPTCFKPTFNHTAFQQRQSNYSSFYQLTPDFPVPTVAEQISALQQEPAFQLASAELRWMTKKLVPQDGAAERDVGKELLNYLDCASPPNHEFLPDGLASYFTSISKTTHYPRLRACAEVFYSTPTSEAACERVIGILRRKIGDNKFNYSLPTLTAMLIKQTPFDKEQLELK
jgi:hypothetical protein